MQNTLNRRARDRAGSDHRQKAPFRRALAAVAAAVIAAVLPMLAGAIPAATAAPIECTTPTAFLGTTPTGGSVTQLMVGPMTTDPIAFSPVGPATVLYNAMGWNPTDGFLYAIANGGGLLRIDPTTGAVTNLGVTTPALPAGIPTGAFDAAGNYYVMPGTNTTMYRIDVATRTATVVTLSAVPNASDITLGPGGFLWGATGNSAPANSIVRINPTTGAVAFFPVPAGMETVPGESGFGGAFAYPNGDLGFVRNTPGEIFRVRITNPATANPTITLVSQQSSPSVGALDATSCPVPPAVALCPVSSVYYGTNVPTQFLVGTYGAGTVTFVPAGASTHTFNSMGYNPVDGFIYAISDALHVLRIDPTTGGITDLGPTVPPLPTGTNVGAFDAAGNYYVMGGGTTTLHRIDVNTLARTPITLSAVPDVADFTFAGGFLWGASNTNIVRINPTTGAVTFFPLPAGMSGANFGAAFTYGNGDVGFGRNTPGAIFRVAITNPASATPTFTLVSTQTAPDAPANLDAAACIAPPTDLGVTKAGPPTVGPGGLMSWTITVTNNGTSTSSGFSLNDVVPALYTNVASTTPGCSVVGNAVSCTGGALLPGQSTTITITATAPLRKLCMPNTVTLSPNDAEPAGTDANNTSTLVTCTKAVSKAAVVAASVNWSLGTGLPGPAPTLDFAFGQRPLTPLMGDWDANGTITVGYLHNPLGTNAPRGSGTFYLNNQNDSSAPDITFTFFGDPRGYAVAGDYDGNGYDDVAVFRCGNWEIQYLDANGAIAGRTESFRLEAPFSQACTWPAGVPVAGDWDGDGIDGIGTYDLATGTWVLKNTVGPGGPDIGPFVFWGGSSSYPVVGDWNGDGIDTPGYRIGQTWTTRNTVATVSPTTSFVFGVANSVPFTW